MSDNDTGAGSNPYSAPQSNVTEEVAHGAQLASLGERFVAALIDSVIVGCVAFVPAMIFYGGWMGYVGAAAASPLVFKVGGGLFGVVVFLVINGAFLARDGQTIGKKVMKTKIVRNDGSKADFGRLLGYRYAPIWICQMIPFVGLLCLLDVLFIFRESRHCIHDDIADTKVIKA